MLKSIRLTLEKIVFSIVSIIFCIFYPHFIKCVFPGKNSDDINHPPSDNHIETRTEAWFNAINEKAEALKNHPYAGDEKISVIGNREFKV